MDNKDAIIADVLKTSLTKFAKRSDVNLCGSKVERATSSVEGLLSTVFRVKAFYKFGDEKVEHSKGLIFKKLPDTEYQVDLVNERGMFLKEALYYEKIVPIFEKVSSGRTEIPLPQCYHVTSGVGDDVIVMEDLKDSGYATVDRNDLTKGLDLAHCRLSMKCLGRLHGLAAAGEKSVIAESGGWTKVFPLLNREGCFFEAVKGRLQPPMLKLTENTMKTLLHCSREIKGSPMEAEASGVLAKAVEGAWKTFLRLIQPDPEDVNVLCHGDYWMNNVMFKYKYDDSGNKIPTDAKAIDVQLVRYSHPCIDIFCFLYLSTRKPLRDAHFREILSVYHDSLTETLKIVEGGHPKISLQRLIEDMNGRYKIFGVLLAVVLSPAVMLGSEFMPKNFEELNSKSAKNLFETGNAEMVKKRFASDTAFRSNMEEVIREFVEVALPNGPNSLDASPLIL